MMKRPSVLLRPSHACRRIEAFGDTMLLHVGADDTDGRWTLDPAHTAVYAPRNSIHTFRNPNSEPLEMLIQTIPGGFDRFFLECAAEFSKHSPPNMDTIVKISARYGIYYVEPSATP